MNNIATTAETPPPVTMGFNTLQGFEFMQRTASQYYAWEFNAIKEAILSGRLILTA